MSYINDSDFKKLSKTQVYTFIPTGSPDGLMFTCKNLDAAHPVIKSISQNGYEVTVTFYPGLDAAAAGLTRANALKAELYAVFMDGAVRKQLTVTLSVSDCQCCPGLFIPEGEYYDIGPVTSLPDGSTTANMNGSAADSLLSSKAANGFANNKTGSGLCYYYRDANSSGTGSGGSSNYGWHNAFGSSSATAPYKNGGVCQTEEGIDADDAHADWRLPNLGELAQIGQLVSNSPVGAIKAGVGSQAEINKAINKGTGYSPYGSLPAGTVTANGTYNMAVNTFWSSTEFNASQAWRWLHGTYYRRADDNPKGTIAFVRCVRRF
jgi:uncharacterized protein (TIGR02145 family)